MEASGALADVNKAAEAADLELARSIDARGVDAIVLVSACAQIFRHTIEAVVRQRIPVLGTGGACLGIASAAGAVVLDQKSPRFTSRVLISHFNAL